MEPEQTLQKPRRSVLWNRSDRLALTALLGVWGIYLVYLSATHTTALGYPPTIDSDRVKLVREKINPNTAPPASLRRLPMIGPVKADAIVARRRAGRTFKSAEDLENVRGIGPEIVKRIRKHLTFNKRPK